MTEGHEETGYEEKVSKKKLLLLKFHSCVPVLMLRFLLVFILFTGWSNAPLEGFK